MRTAPGQNGLVRPADQPADEQARLSELRSLGLLDTEPDERFERVTRLAQRLFDVPIALVSLVDHDRQWFKSRQGLEASETPREASFCAHAILHDDVMHVADAAADDRFVDNPLVTGDPGIRFYAGCPITGPRGAKLGTLCIIGREPRALSEADVASLRDLAEVVEREIAALHLAAADELTGLANRRGFDLLAAKMLDVCRRNSMGATLLYMDLARFKAINDQYGHAVGDGHLQEFAGLLERTFRTSDVIARLGGDEFVVLLTGSAEHDQPGERLRHALQEYDRTGAWPHRLEVSIGATRFDPASAETLEDLLHRADTAMYADKQASR